MLGFKKVLYLIIVALFFVTSSALVLAIPDMPTLNSPTDGATGISIIPTLNVTVTDSNGGNLNVSFYELSDTIVFNSNLTDASQAIQSVYADSKYIYSGGTDTNVQIYNHSNFGLVTELTSAGSTVFTIYADSDYLYAGGFDQKVQVYNITNLSLVTELTSAGNSIIAVFADSNYIYAGGNDDKVQVYWRHNFTHLTNLSSAGGDIKSVYADSDYIYAGGTDNKVQVYNITDFSLVTQLVSATGDVNSVFADSDYIYAGGQDDKIQVYSRSTFGLVTELTSAASDIVSVYADTNYIYSGGYDESVQVYWLSNLTLKTELTSSGHNIFSVFSDPEYIYAGGFDNSVQVYNQSTLIGVDNNVLNGSDATTTWSGLSEASVYSWFATSTDKANYNTYSDWWNFTTDDFTPSLTSSSISPNATAISSGSLKGFCNGTDPNSDNLTYYYRWYLNGGLNYTGVTAQNFTHNTQININTISSSDLSDGDNWIFSCLANDGTYNSTWLNSSVVTIYNETQYISSCRELNQSGVTYKITSTISTPYSDCFTVPENNITLDCQYNLVRGKQHYYTVYLERDSQETTNLTVINCDFEYNVHALYFNNGNGNQVYDSIFDEFGSYDYTGTIQLEDSKNNNFSNLSFGRVTSPFGFDLSNSTFCSNSITGSTGENGEPILYYNSSVDISNLDYVSDLILCDADNSHLANISDDYGSAWSKLIYLIYTDNTTINNATAWNRNILINLQNSTGNRLSNIYINSTGKAGLFISSSSNNTFSNISSDGSYSTDKLMYSYYSSYNIYDNLSLYSYDEVGVSLSYCHDELIKNTNIYDCSDSSCTGISSHNNYNMSFINISISNTRSYGAAIWDSPNTTIHNVTINSTTATGYPAFDLLRSENSFVDGLTTSCQGGCYTPFTTNLCENSIFNNMVSFNQRSNNKYYKLSYVFSGSNLIVNNISAYNSDMGLTLYSLTDSLFNNITLNNINGTGILVAGTATSNNTIINSRVTNSLVGVDIEVGTDLTFYNNYFNNIDNFNISPGSNNTWNTTKTLATNIVDGINIGGNFWGYPNGTGFSQTCSDVDSDGICDSVYVLDVDNIDHLPLISVVPVVSSVAIDPSSYASTTETLIGYCTGSGGNGGNLTYYYKWFINSTVNETGNTLSDYTPSIQINPSNISYTLTQILDNWTFSCMVSDGSSNSTWLNSSVTQIESSSPVFNSFSYTTPITLSSGTNVTIDLQANISDYDDDLNTSSIYVYYNKTGQSNMVTNCNIISTAGNWTYFNCSVNMTYYTESGYWDINLSISDDYSNEIINASETTTVNVLDSISLNITQINFGSISTGINDTLGSQLGIYNYGNSDYSTIQLKGHDLNESTGVELGASNFCANDIADANTGCDTLINATYVTVSGLSLSHGLDVYDILYPYVDVPLGLTYNVYTARSAWVVSAS